MRAEHSSMFKFWKEKVEKWLKSLCGFSVKLFYWDSSTPHSNTVIPSLENTLDPKANWF